MEITVTWPLILFALVIFFGLVNIIYGLIVISRGPQSDYDFITPMIGVGIVFFGLMILLGLFVGYVIWG